MASNDKRREWARLSQGFRTAFSGLKTAFFSERNLQIHVFIGFIVIILAFIFHVSYIEKLVLLIVIGIVIALELVNTAIERTVDMMTGQKHPLAKLAKDTSAAAVLFFAIIAVMIGLAIFIHSLYT